jgi:two-component system phosphate regulon response regulator PhoB
VHKILVIDDDPTGTQLLLTLLDMEGFQGSKLENWDAPLDDVKAQAPDLVIMDVHLKVGNGLDLLRQIRKDPDRSLASVPVVMISAEKLEAQSLSAGANGFVEKPFDLGNLFGAIRRIMEGNLLDS